jgi:hypothetical protein
VAGKPRRNVPRGAPASEHSRLPGHQRQSDWFPAAIAAILDAIASVAQRALAARSLGRAGTLT